MDIVINGAAGRMGRILTDMIASEPNCRAAALVDQSAAPGCLTSLSDYDGPADVLIDFSHHAAAEAVTAYCLRRNLPAVIATTGQTEAELRLIREASEAVPVFLSANMSIGVALVAELARQAAAVFPEADIEIVERHHNQKLDVPSGTALLLARRIGEVRPGARFVVGRHENGKRTANEIGIHSLRYGGEVGTHEIVIAAAGETVTLKHEAESRGLFARGALAAARFLVGRGPGLYDMRDIIAQGGQQA